MATQYEYIDVSYLVEMSDNNLDFMKEIIRVFRKQSVELHDLMQDSFREGKYDELKAVLHKAKSATAVMGIHELINKLKVYEGRDITEIENVELKKFIESFGIICRKAIFELDTFVNNYIEN